MLASPCSRHQAIERLYDLHPGVTPVEEGRRTSLLLPFITCMTVE